MRGGISMPGKRYARVNNRLVRYDPSKPTNYIIYSDANNLYGWPMSLPLPKSGFKWKCTMPTEEQIMKMKPHSKKGRILEVDLEYPEELHDSHNSYPLAPEKKVVTQMSKYQMRVRADLNIDPPNSKNLVLTL